MHHASFRSGDITDVSYDNENGTMIVHIKGKESLHFADLPKQLIDELMSAKHQSVYRYELLHKQYGVNKNPSHP